MAYADLADVLEWTVNPTTELHAFATSDTEGWKNRVAGTGDWTATVRALAQGAAPVLTEGTAYLIKLFEDKDQATSIWSGPAMLASTDVTVAIDSGAVIEYNYNFEGNGALVAPTGGAAAVLSAKNAKMQWDVPA